MFVFYLQIDALGKVYDFEIENLSKVHFEIVVRGSTLCSGNFLVIVKDPNEKRVSGYVLSSIFFSPEMQSPKSTSWSISIAPLS